MAGNLATRKMLYRLLAQYPLDSKFARMLEAVGLLYDELDQILEYLMFRRYIDLAEGVHLDRIGVLLGYPRPYTEREDVFTYRAVGDTNYVSKGFGAAWSMLGGAYSTVTGLFTDTLLDDDTYRALLYIRAKSINADPSIPSIYTWITDSFGVECTLAVPSPGRIEVTVTSGSLSTNERYLIQNKSPAMPGVSVVLLT